MSTQSPGTNSTAPQASTTRMNRTNPMRPPRIIETITDSLTFQGHTIQRYTREDEHRIRIIEPDGTVFDNMVFGPTVPDDLHAMLAHHRKGKPKPDVPQLSDRERIELLEKRVKRLEDLMNAPPEKIDIPAFLKPTGADMEFSDDFITREALAGEERADTIRRLQLLFEVLTNRSYGGPLSDTDQARLSELTTNLRLGG